MLGAIDFLSILALSFLVILFFNSMLGSRYEKWKCFLYNGAGVLGLFALFLVMRVLDWEAVRWIFLPALFLFLFSCIGLEGETDIKLFLSVFTISVIVISMSLGTLLIGFFAKASYCVVLLEMSVEHCALLILIDLVFFYAAKVMLKLNRRKMKLNAKDFTFLLIIPVVSVVSIFALLSLVPEGRLNVRTLPPAMFVLVGITVTNLLSYYFYIEMGKEQEMELKYLVLQRQYDFLQDSSGEMKRYYEETNKIYHDFKHYLTVVLAYLEEESTEEAKDFLKQIIQMKSTFTHHRVICDNNAVNYILNYALSKCLDKGIDFVCTVTASLAGVDDMDFCVLLNNLLDNAIEASEKEEQPGIRLTIAQGDQWLEVKVMNRIAHSVLEDNPRLSTTKHGRGRHGFGIPNAREAVKKFGGGAGVLRRGRILLLSGNRGFLEV